MCGRRDYCDDGREDDTFANNNKSKNLRSAVSIRSQLPLCYWFYYPLTSDHTISDSQSGPCRPHAHESSLLSNFWQLKLTKAQLSKAGPTASSTKSYCKSDGVIHNFFSHYSYCSSLTFSVLMPSKISHYKNTHSTQVSILPWHGWQVKKATLSVYTVAGEWPVPAGWLCWLQGFTLTHLLQTARHQCEQQLCSPRPAQEAVYGLIWRSHQSLAFQFCSCHQPSAFLHLQIPTAKLVLIGCQNQNLTDNCHESQVVETAEGIKVLHHSLPKSGCLISRIRNVVFIFCHPTELGISECQPQKPMCSCLDRMPTQGLYVWFAFNSLRVSRERKKRKKRLQTRKWLCSRVPVLLGP